MSLSREGWAHVAALRRLRNEADRAWKCAELLSERLVEAEYRARYSEDQLRFILSNGLCRRVLKTVLVWAEFFKRRGTGIRQLALKTISVLTMRGETFSRLRELCREDLQQHKALIPRRRAYEFMFIGDAFSFRPIPQRQNDATIAMAASRHVVESLETAFTVIPALPQNAGQLADEISPDLVLIESGVFMPGETWSPLGTLFSPALETALNGLIEEFQRRSVPVVFWWTTPLDATPALAAIARRCDTTVSDDSVPGVSEASPLSLGVDFDRIDPVHPADRNGASSPLLHLSRYEPDPRTVPANRLVRAALDAGAEVLFEPGHLRDSGQTLQPGAELSRYRTAGWTVPTASGLSHRCIAMLASGVPVLASSVPDGFRQVVTEVGDGADVIEAVEYARRQIADPRAMRDILRAVHGFGTSRCRFAPFLEELGIEPVPLHEDGIGISAGPCLNVDDIVAVVDNQSIAPTEVLVEDAEIGRRLAARLQLLGVAVRSPNSAEAPRHALWKDECEPWPKTWLHDLLIASRITGKDCLSDGAGIVMRGQADDLEASLPWWMTEG